jgi:hypothetical protein
MIDDKPTITPITEVPLGYEPIADSCDEETAIELFRATTNGQNQFVLLVHDSDGFAVWVFRYHFWIH